MKTVKFIFAFLLFNSIYYIVISQNKKIDSLLNSCKLLNPDTTQCNIYSEIGNLIKKSNPDSALYYYDKALQLAELKGLENQLASALQNIGVIYSEQGNYDKAINVYLESLKISENLGDKNGMARCFNSIGNVYIKQGNSDKAIEYNMKSLKLYEALKNTKGISRCYNNMGIIHSNLGNYDKAIEYYLKSIKMREILADKNGLLSCYNNIGIVYSKLGSLQKKDHAKRDSLFDIAIGFYLKSQKICEALGDKSGLSTSFINIGVIHKNQGNFEKALEYLTKSLKLFKELGRKRSIADAYGNLSSLHIKMADSSGGSEAASHLKAALEFGEMAFKLSEEMKALSLKSNSALTLMKVHKRLGNFKKANEYADVYINTKDSLFNEEKIKVLAEAEKKFESEKQQLLIEKQKSEILRQKIVLGFVISGLILIAVFAVYVVQRLRITREQKRIIEEQNIELEKHRTRLEELVQDRTAELVMAKEKAEESDRLKSAFLANMSHEIRTPMNSIIGFSSLLIDNEVEDRQKRDYIKLIINNSNSLLHLIDDIINISIMEAGHLKIRKQTCDIHKIFYDLFQSFSLKLNNTKDKNIQLFNEITQSDSGLFMNTDPERLVEIFSNLIDNAIKFTEKGSVHFGYEIHEQAGEQSIRFYVKDTGIGLTETQQSQLFVRFSRVSETKEKLYRGAGLGLSISKNLVELLGGKIGVESEANVGSTFYFTLPYQSLSSDEWSHETMAANSTIPNMEGMTILIAEDEDGNFQFLEAMLGISKAKIIRAHNGFEAVEIVKQTQVDLILMDIKMPQMNGLEATKIIKSMGKNIPIIAQTAFAFESDEINSYQSGCDAFISKPINQSKLVGLVNQYLKKEA